MVTRWGMSDAVGMVQLAPRQNPYLGGPTDFAGDKPFSEATARLVDAEVSRIINECHEQAKRLLREHRPALDALVKALLERETIDREDLDLLVRNLPLPPRVSTPPSAPPVSIDKPRIDPAPLRAPVLGAPPAEPAGA